MGTALVLMVLVSAVAVGAALWAVRRNEVRAQPVRLDYDSRRPLP